jgi:hypothetical protein
MEPHTHLPVAHIALIAANASLLTVPSWDGFAVALSRYLLLSQ